MFNLFQTDSKKYQSVWVSKNRNNIRGISSTNTIQTERLNIVPILKSAVGQLMPLAESKRIDLEVRLVSEVIFAETDADCFCLLAYNLIGHSLKDAPLYGHVTVDAYTEGLDFVFTVRHNGIAFTKEEVTFLFDLVQDHTSTVKRPLAPGMGLDSVKQVVDAHKGQLFAESREGRGASYEVRLHMIGDVYQ